MLPIMCTSKECDENCETEVNFLNHLKKSHKNDRDFNCYACFKSFSIICRLRRHLSSCKNAVSFKLPLRNDTHDNSDIQGVTIATASTDIREAYSEVPFLIVDENVTCVNETNIEVIPTTANLDLEVPVEKSNTVESSKSSGSFGNPTDGMYEITLKLLGKMSVTKTTAFEMFNDVMLKIVKPILEEVKSENASNFEQLELQINKYIDTHGTEYKFRKSLKEKQMYFPAKKFNILRAGSIGRSPKGFGYLFPIEDNIRVFFELHDEALREMIAVTDLGNTEINGNIFTVIDSVIWKEKIEGYEGRHVLPITVYNDDVEVNNPLGSKRGVEKISAVYISFPLLGKFFLIFIF